jgi:TPR repeat protein
LNPEFSIPGAFLPKEPGAEPVPERGLWELLGEPQGEGLDSDTAASGQADYHPFRPGFDSAAFDGLNAATTITQLIALLEEESEDKREIVRFAEKSIGELPLHAGVDESAVCEGLERLSALGILKADFTLGRVYDGQGNRTKAIEYYEKAYFRDSSPPSALLLRLGELYLEGERDQEVWGRGVAMILQAHRQGDFRATFKLGLCLQKGRGVGLDEVQGYQLVKEAWKRSLREEDPYYPARVQMAECLFRGKGIVADPEKGFHYLLDAAENGRYPRAIENLILCLRNGWGTKPDPESAVTWASRLNELQ